MELPDLRAQLRGSPQRCTFLDPERVVKLLQVHMRPDGAELARRVRIHCDAPAQFGLTPVRSPHLRQGQEKALLGCETVDLLSPGWIPAQCALQRFEGNARSAQVSDIF